MATAKVVKTGHGGGVNKLPNFYTTRCRVGTESHVVDGPHAGTSHVRVREAAVRRDPGDAPVHTCAHAYTHLCTHLHAHVHTGLHT